MFVQIHCVHSPLVVETDFILPTPLSNSTMQNHPPESPTSTRPCPKLVLSDGDWATSQHDIAVEWVSHCAKRHAGGTSTPHHIISDAHPLCWPLRSRFPHPFARPFARLLPSCSLTNRRRPSSFRTIQVPSCASARCLPPRHGQGSPHVLPTRGLERLCHVPETKSVMLLPWMRFSLLHLEESWITTVRNDLSWLQGIAHQWHPDAALPPLPPASSYRGRPSSCVLPLPQLSTHARPSRHDSLELPCYECGHTSPTRHPLSMRPSTRTPLRAGWPTPFTALVVRTASRNTELDHACSTHATANGATTPSSIS